MRYTNLMPKFFSRLRSHYTYLIMELWNLSYVLFAGVDYFFSSQPYALHYFLIIPISFIYELLLKRYLPYTDYFQFLLLYVPEISRWRLCVRDPQESRNIPTAACGYWCALQGSLRNGDFGLGTIFWLGITYRKEKIQYQCKNKIFHLVTRQHRTLVGCT